MINSNPRSALGSKKSTEINVGPSSGYWERALLLDFDNPKSHNFLKPLQPNGNHHTTHCPEPLEGSVETVHTRLRLEFVSNVNKY